MGHPELIRVPEFVTHMTFTDPDTDTDLQQNISLYLATLGESAPFVRLLKAACSQAFFRLLDSLRSTFSILLDRPPTPSFSNPETPSFSSFLSLFNPLLFRPLLTPF